MASNIHTRHNRLVRRLVHTLSISLLLVSIGCVAQGSKLLGTGGTSSVEGSAGGGIVPWATIGSYASSGEWGVTVGHSRVGVDDFSLVSNAVALQYDNRYELSVARQKFWVDPLALPLDQQIFGAKINLTGDLIYSALPQLSVGVQYKHHQNGAVPLALGAAKISGTDWYLAASKVYLDAIAGRNLLLNATLRRTSANQLGLLGFGADGHNSASWVGEFSAAVLLRHDLAIGAEFRQKPDQLTFAREDHWRDVFVAWFVNRHASVVAGYVDLGSIAGLSAQTGYYIALQGAF